MRKTYFKSYLAPDLLAYNVNRAMKREDLDTQEKKEQSVKNIIKNSMTELKDLQIVINLEKVREKLGNEKAKEVCNEILECVNILVETEANEIIENYSNEEIPIEVYVED